MKDSDSSHIALFGSHVTGVCTRESASCTGLVLKAFRKYELFGFDIQPVLDIIGPSLETGSRSAVRLNDKTVEILCRTRVQPVDRAVQMKQFVRSQQLAHGLHKQDFFLFIIIA